MIYIFLTLVTLLILVPLLVIIGQLQDLIDIQGEWTPYEDEDEDGGSRVPRPTPSDSPTPLETEFTKELDSRRQRN